MKMKKIVLSEILLAMTMGLSSCISNNAASEVSLSSLYSWINELSVENVDYILSGSLPGTIAPTMKSFNIWSMAKENTEMDQTIDFLQSAKVETSDYFLPDGGRGQALIVYLKSGVSHEIYTNGRIFIADEAYYSFTTDLPSFSISYGQQFLFQSVWDFALYDGEVEADYDHSLLRGMIFKEEQDEVIADSAYDDYSFVGDLGTIKFKTAKTFDLILDQDITTYTIINNYSFSLA